MEIAQQEKVYVAVGKDCEEGLGTLRWALSYWKSQTVSFVILHVTNNSKDFVHTSFGKLRASSVNDETLEVFRAREDARVDKLLSRYMALCCKVKAEVMKVDKSEESVHKILVGLISSLGIKKLVMGITFSRTLSWKGKSSTEITGSCYVHKHKPDFCELFIVSSGKLIFLRNGEREEGGYFEDERGAMVADMRKKLKEKGSFKGWLGRRLSDNLSNTADRGPSSPTGNGTSPDNDNAELVQVQARWEDNAQEIKRYIECLLASNDSGESKEDDDSMVLPKLERTHDSISSSHKTEDLRAKLEEAEKLVEKKKSEVKSNVERRTKAEWAISLCNHRAEEIESQVKVEMCKQAHLNEELNALREQLRQASGDIADSKSNLGLVKATESELLIKLQSSSLAKSVAESELERATRERDRMALEMEEMFRQRDAAKQRIEHYQRREQATTMTNNLSCGYREFTADEVGNATNNFSEENMIVGGAQRQIYKGSIHHTSVAIESSMTFWLHSPKEFKDQVEILRQIRHPHIVTMIGACMDRRCIVFEHMPRGSLRDALLPATGKEARVQSRPAGLPWQARIRIAFEAASAVAFLHSGPSGPIAHGRLSPSSVLLDRHLSAKIAAPQVGSLSGPGSDTAALGLLVLQLLTGREVVGPEEVRWALLEGGQTALMELVDPMAGDWPLDLAAEFAGIGVRYCAEENNDVLSGERTAEMSRELGDLTVRADGEDKGGARKHAVDVPDVFLCPIFQEVMKEPHVAEDGFSYELEAIKEWLDSGHQTSPMTNLKLKHKLLTPNHTLSSLVSDWHQLNR